jgi:Asp-tRNA(Asn)/Glu-tRNA(Gln) amidotransferase A subunit family amidase
MSDSDAGLSSEAIAALAKLIGLPQDHDRFDAFSDAAKKYTVDAAALRLAPVDNSVAPLLTFHPPHPEVSGPVVFDVDSLPASSRPAEPIDLAFLSASELAALVRDRSVSPVELTELYLERLDTIGRELNCVVNLTPKFAMAQARQAEAEAVKGEFRSAIHGIPWGAKDLLATKAAPTTWGATPYSEQVLDYDSAVVDRLEKSGAVLAAKLSMGSLAYGANWFGGMTRNPWDTDTASGGSSAGPGAATAAGLVGFSLGTETHGSITSPSHTCGVTGLRPTFGRVSRYGAMALAYSMDKIGPMCRSAADCAAVFASIAGQDDRDDVTVDAPFAWPCNRDVRSMRIGIVKSEYDAVEDPQASVDRDALVALKDLGATLGDVALPDCPPGLLLTLWVEAAAAFGDLARTPELDALYADSSNWPHIMRAARTVSAVDYVRAQQLRRRLVHDFTKTMRNWDVIVCPGIGESSLTISNLTGHPSLTLPAGFVDGMPRGMTLIGNYWDEARILAIGQAYQAVTDWHKRRPSIDA